MKRQITLPIKKLKPEARQLSFSVKSLLIFVLIFGMVGSFLLWRSFATSGVYHVSGNMIIDPNGAQFTSHGVARPSLEWSCSGSTVNGSAGIPATDFTTMRDKWNANSVRLALNQDFWLPGAAKYCPGYQSTVKSAVASARQAGLVVILDLHWSDQGNLANPSPGQQCMADQNSVSFWQQLASTYKDDSGVWFELYNEPQNISWDVWKNGGNTCGFQAVGMQALYDTVRNTGANNIVVANGIGWGAHLDGVPLLSGSNITYGIHPYANKTDPTAWSNNDWNNRFGYLTGQVPVIATEFGKFQCGVDSYDQGILDFFRSHNMGYTAWAWYAGGCNFPSLVSDEQGDCVNGGCVTQQDMLSYATNRTTSQSSSSSPPPSSPPPAPTTSTTSYTYYVDGTNGSDSNAGTSPGAAWKTLSKVNSVTLGPSQSVAFAGGQTFSGSLSPNGSGSSSSQTVYTSYGSGKAIIYGASAVPLVTNGTSYVTVSNLIIDGGSAKTCVSLGAGTKHVTFDSDEIRNCNGQGINEYSATNGYITVQNSYIHNTTDSAIIFTGPNHTSDLGGDLIQGNQIEYVASGDYGGCRGTAGIGYGAHGIYGDSVGLIVRNNDIGNFSCTDGQAVSLRFEKALVEGNTFHDGPLGVAYINESTSETSEGQFTSTIRYNRIWNMSSGGNAGYGIDIGTKDHGTLNSPENFSIYNNTITSTNARGCGIALSSDSSVTDRIQNNIISGAWGFGQYCYNSGTVVANHNDWAGSGNFPSGAGDITVSPNLTAPPNLAPNSSSQVINSGTTSVNGASFSSSCNGIPLSYCGTEPDMGAVEASVPGSMPTPTPAPIPTPTPTPSMLPAPSGLIATPNANSVTLTWNAVAGADSYNVWRIGQTYTTPWASVTGTTFTNAGEVVAGTRYCYQISSVNSAGEGSKSAQACATPGDTVVPTVTLSTPSNNAVAGKTVTISGTASDNVAVAGVQLQIDGQGLGAEITSNPGSFSMNWDSTTVSNGSHTITAVARDAAGNSKSTSVVVNVSNGDTTPPSVPTNLQATAAAYNKVSLSWTASSDNVGVTSYAIVRGGVTIATVPTASYSDATVTGATSYSYQVVALDAAGNHSAASTSVSVATPKPPDTVPPSVPINLIATAVSPTQVNLSWSASSDNTGVTAYVIYRNGSKYATVAPTSFGDADLSPSTTYNYYVVAVDAAGNQSAASSPVSATTAAQPSVTNKPSVPTGLKATPGNGYVALTWKSSPASDTVTVYNVYRVGQPYTGPWVSVAGTSFTNRDLVTNGTTYCYQLSATNASGESAKSAQVCATPSTKPAPPSGIKALAGNGYVTLSWSFNPTADAVTGYNVYRTDQKFSTPWVTVTGNTFTNASTVTNGTTYCYQLSATNASGEGLKSDPVCATPKSMKTKAVIESETMSIPTYAASVKRDTAASGGKYLYIYRSVPASASARLGSPAHYVSLRAKGQLCNGRAPHYQIKVDGATVANGYAPATIWSSYIFPVNISSGWHSVGLYFDNDYYVNSQCDVNLLADNLNFYP